MIARPTFARTAGPRPRRRLLRAPPLAPSPAMASPPMATVLCTRCLQTRAAIALPLATPPTRWARLDRFALAAGRPQLWTSDPRLPERTAQRSVATVARARRPRAERGHASLATATGTKAGKDDVDIDIGPLEEYDRRVAAGQLRDDEHQRGIIQSLQNMHDELRDYHAPAVVHPRIEDLKPQRRSLLRSWFGGGGGGGSGGGGSSSGRGSGKDKGPLGRIPANLPRGLYLYGDVGSGKTMLMDLFYETLPRTVRSKTRIHFHNFMQDVHKRLHRLKMEHGNDIDGVPFVAADIAERGNVLCFDEFQCTDVADAMILRRLLESLMAHGVVLVTTSNRHPDELYKNGIQRESFLPAIALLKQRLHVINLDSPTDYRKIPRPPSGVYHTPLDSHAASHALKWFRFLGDAQHPEPHAEVQKVWGREIRVPRVSGRCAWFTFDELIGRPTSAADYLELVRAYDAFVVTDVPGMTHRQRDLARRFITFIDAVYESHAKLVLTTEVPLNQLFVSKDEIRETLQKKAAAGAGSSAATAATPSSAAATAAVADADAAGGISDSRVDEALDHLVDDMEGHNMMTELKSSNLFTGEEEAFAFGRALSRLTQMGSTEWVERGMGLESQGGKQERDAWAKVRSRQMEDSM